MTASRPAALAYRPEIDGLRAVAIVPVVLFHAGVPGFAGGYLGVDVFFVISGYLITGLLAHDVRATGRIDFARFYERRVRRIVPALIAVLAGAAALAWWTMTAEDMRQFGQALVASALFTPNVLYALHTDYFASPDAYRPLIHTWTLGVEEQFYLLWPLAFAVIARGPRRALSIIAAVAAASFALAAIVSLSEPRWAFYLLPTRMWELLAGAWCALLPPARAHRPLADGAGAAALLAGFIVPAVMVMPAGPWDALLPVIGTALLLRHANASRGVGAVLARRGPVAIGRSSYGTYLSHMPLIATLSYVHQGAVPALLRAAAVALAFALGWLSWRFIETPIRTRRALPRARTLLFVCGGGLAALAALGLALHFRAATSRIGTLEERLGGRFAGKGVGEIVAGPAPPAFLLYGDSHARQYFPALERRIGGGALLSRNACLSLPGLSNRPVEHGEAVPCERFWTRLVAAARQQRPPMIVWSQAWDRALPAPDGRPAGLVMEDGGRALTVAVEKTLAALPPGTRVIIVGTAPHPAYERYPAFAGGWARCTAFLDARCPTSFPLADSDMTAANRTLAVVAGRHPGVVFVDPADALCHAGQCTIVVGGRLRYSDAMHLTAAGAALVAQGIAAAAPPP